MCSTCTDILAMGIILVFMLCIDCMLYLCMLAGGIVLRNTSLVHVYLLYLVFVYMLPWWHCIT